MNLYIITGSSKGLGLALHDALASDEDNHVIGISRLPTTPLPTTRLANSAANIHIDLAAVESIAPAFAAIEAMIAGKKYAHAVLLNNAGVVGPVGKFDQLDVAETARNINVNLVAPMVLTRLFVQATRGLATSRLVVNISSGAAKRAIAGWSAYCAAKAGLEMATRGAALEAANDPALSICSLAPGVVDTPMQAQVRGVSEEAFPDVERFRAMKADGVLREPGAVARDIIALIASGKLTNGGNFDIREMTAS